TFKRCRQALSSVADCQTSIEVLPREPSQSRFTGSRVLQHLEEHWTQPKEFTVHDLRFTNEPPATGPKAGLVNRKSQVANHLRLICCPNPEAEATFAAREILRQVRAGGRYRDCAVLLRPLDHYSAPLR